MAEEEIEEESPTEDANVGEDEPEEKYTINRIMIKPGKCLTLSKDENLANRLPVLPQEPKAYTPMTYTFRVPTTSTPTKVTDLLARSPPFHLLLDHTIAVLWILFGSGEFESPLGINQLQWALAFLKTAQTRTGDYSQDIDVCIGAIENILVEQYADLNAEIVTAERLDENVHYGGGALGSCTMVTQEIPFSLNYSEMIIKSPPNIFVLSPGGSSRPMSMTSLECEEALEKLKQAAGVDSIENLDSVSREKAINVLKMWKSDQVEKIRGELRRLRSIEDKMRDIDTNFAGYMEDEPEQLIRSD